MKHTFKKAAAIILAALMCVSAMVPVFAANTCPGTGKTHTAYNCTYVQVSEQKATCETEGFVTGKCTTCSAVFNASQSPALGHDWNDIVPATCDSAATRTCKVCSKKITVSPALTHLYTAYTVSGGVCKTGERITRTCIYCGLEDKKIIGTDGHEFALTSYIEPSNCTVAGEARYTCVVNGCGETKSMPIKPTAASHAYAHWVTVKGNAKDPNAVAPTCSANGRASIVCRYCDDIKVISVAALAHSTAPNGNLSARQEAKPATCTTSGLMAYRYCLDCRAYFNEAGTEKVQYADLVIPAHHSNPAKLAVTTEVLPNCVADGWQFISCSECTAYANVEVKLPRYTSHVYYANVTNREQKVNILKALGLYSTEESVESMWKALGNVEFGGLGQNKVWKNYIPATCNTDASVTWMCLNCTANKDGAYVMTSCDLGQTTVPSGTEYLRTEHKFATVYPSTNTIPGVAYADQPAATCATSGMRIFYCVNEYRDASGNLVDCNVTRNEAQMPLGHDWKKVDSITTPTPATTVAATCLSNGTQCYECANGCGTTKVETVISTGAEHKWAYIGEGVAAQIAALKCNQTLNVTRYCTMAGCVFGSNPTTYLAKGPDHEYFDISKPANLEAIVALDIVTNPTIEVNGKAVVVYMAAGNCERGATYRLNCYRCDMFQSYTRNEGFAQGHKKTYISNTSVAATCTQNGGSDQWYCSNKGCSYYVDDTAGTPVLPSTWSGRDTIYAANHYVWNPTTKAVNVVTFRNVPDTKISGALSLAAAQAIEAPVDSKGNVTKAIAIEGTSLVWIYKYTAKDHSEATVNYGGLYCVDCRSYTGEGSVYLPAALGHSYSFKQSVAATCQNYGYTLYECVCGDAYQANYAKISSHSYLFLNSSNREATWNNLTAAQKEGRAYLAPTCAMAGYAIDVCTVCDLTSTVSLNATGHRNAAGQALTTSCRDIPTDRKCIGCTMNIPKNHDYGSDNLCKVCGISK